jgi:hypothetical protein
MSFSTAWCANALSICSSCGLSKVDRIEVSRRFLLRASAPLEAPERAVFAALVHDRMTEQVYPQALTSFASDTVPAPVATIPVVAEGRAALERINKVGRRGLLGYRAWLQLLGVNAVAAAAATTHLFVYPCRSGAYCMHVSHSSFHSPSLPLRRGWALPLTSGTWTTIQTCSGRS